ncbi:MAG: hypothetical protein ACI4R9_02230 [Kiritimatiellia bacterium]
MFHKGFFLLLSFLPTVALSAGETAPLTDGEVWNQGVDYYRAGDLTNAVRVLRPLILTRDFGPRAAEIVAKIAYDAAHAAEAKEPLKDLEEAAAAAQIALRARAGDPRANRNFTRATDGLPALREAAHVNAVLQAHAGKDPSSLLQSATADIRSLMKESATFLELPAPDAVAKSDQLSKRAADLADVWISVRQSVAEAVTNAEQAATIVDQTDRARAATRLAAKQLGDMESAAYTTLADVENDYTRFLKMVILPPAAIRADLVAQSNAWQDVEAFNRRPWQPEALDYTRAFRQKFPAWAQSYEQQAQADTNKPPFTAEAQARISALSTELEKMQMECVRTPDPTLQEKSMEVIREIIDLLPNDGGGNGGQPPNPSPQNQNQDKNNDNRQNSDGRQDAGAPPNPPEESPDEQEQNGDDSDGPEDQEDDGEDPEVQEIEARLKKAQERSDEHEADKKARMRRIPLPPNERDW